MSSLSILSRYELQSTAQDQTSGLCHIF